MRKLSQKYLNNVATDFLFPLKRYVCNLLVKKLSASAIFQYCNESVKPGFCMITASPMKSQPEFAKPHKPTNLVWRKALAKHKERS